MERAYFSTSNYVLLALLPLRKDLLKPTIFVTQEIFKSTRYLRYAGLFGAKNSNRISCGSDVIKFNCSFCHEGSKTGQVLSTISFSGIYVFSINFFP